MERSTSEEKFPKQFEKHFGVNFFGVAIGFFFILRMPVFNYGSKVSTALTG